MTVRTALATLLSAYLMVVVRSLVMIIAVALVTITTILIAIALS
jgi:hypothetical protein